MGNYTDYMEKQLLNTLRGVTCTGKTTWIALILSEPTEAGGYVEITYNGYKRQRSTYSEPSYQNSVSTILNIEEILFPSVDQEVSNPTYYGIFDSEIGGNMLAHAKIENDTGELIMVVGEAPRLVAGDLIITQRGDGSETYKRNCLNTIRGIDFVGFIPYISIFNGDPSSGGSELSGGNYKRMKSEFSVPEEQSNGKALISNSNKIASPVADVNWGLWSHTCIMNKESDGEVVFYTTGPGKQITKSKSYSVLPDTIKLTLS